jgi:hypothetical protein
MRKVMPGPVAVSLLAKSNKWLGPVALGSPASAYWAVAHDGPSSGWG